MDTGQGQQQPAQLRPKTPGLINLAAVGVVSVLVAAVALTSRQTPPPTVAEFAPQAVEQIEESLPEQSDAPSTDDGAGGGAVTPDEEPSPEASATPTPGASTPPVERARVRQCFGSPPRQTEDPQSPPCVPFFDGDNGGATSQGVTADEIRIAYPNAVFFGPEPTALIQLMVDHLNRRYEFYGRKIVLAEYEVPAFAQPDPAAMIADAVKVDEEFQAFASIGYGARNGSEHHYYDELARRGVVSASAGTSALGTDARYARFGPHEWTWNASVSTGLQLTADFACTSLAGRPPVGGAIGGGGPLGSTGPDQRTFGIIVMRTADGTVPPAELLTDGLAGCGHPAAVVVEDQDTAPQADNIILQMSNAGVTTVFCVCTNLAPLRASYMQSASNQGYFPEWVMTGIEGGDVDNSFVAGQAPQEQARNVFGLTYHDRFFPRQQMPWYWAMKESDPAADPQGGVYYDAMSRYAQLLLIASGIQLAGPNLTPETFQAGLQSAAWANPGAGRAPYFQAAVGFPGGRHTWIETGAMFWYSATDGGTVDPAFPGAVCYVDQGTRYAAGRWPTATQPFFQGPCR